MVEAQGARSVEFERIVKDVRTRAEAASDDLQRTRARLGRVVEEGRDRAAEILADTTMLIGAVESQVHEGTLEEEPFEEDPEKEI